jgi:hypothetical protein
MPFTQLLCLIPWHGRVGREGESILLLMRAIRNAVLLFALFVGLPTLAHAHSGHSHQEVTVGQHVELQASAKAAPSATITMQMVAAAATNMKKSTKAAIATDVSQHSVMAMGPDTSTHPCSGGCCCSSSSGCSSGSCCPTFIASSATEFNIQTASNPIAQRLYPSASLLVILGLDRPPKA